MAHVTNQPSLTEARVNVPMTASMYERLRQVSFVERRSMAAILREAFELRESLSRQAAGGEA